MSNLDLGNLKGPLLIFGGPYSNLQATQAIQAKALALGIPPEHCICTGDIVAYCAQPEETTSLIREWGIPCVMGNCEESFAKDAEDCGCGFEEGTQCDLLSAQWFNYAQTQLGDNERIWFDSLPRQITFSINDINAVVIHGSISSINQFIFNSTSDTIFTEQLALTQADLIIGGHCGLPFTKNIHQKIWHNAGAIGMPANDGTPRTWYSIITPQNNGVDIKHYVLEYDHHAAHNAMIKVGMDNGYASGLLSGLWPSMDVLPVQERQQQGKPYTL